MWERPGRTRGNLTMLFIWVWRSLWIFGALTVIYIGLSLFKR